MEAWSVHTADALAGYVVVVVSVAFAVLGTVDREVAATPTRATGVQHGNAIAVHIFYVFELPPLGLPRTPVPEGVGSSVCGLLREYDCELIRAVLCRECHQM